MIDNHDIVPATHVAHYCTTARYKYIIELATFTVPLPLVHMQNLSIHSQQTLLHRLLDESRHG